MSKNCGVLYPASLIELAKSRVKKYAWAEEQTKDIIENAERWVKLSDDELWDMMFGANLERSWMVWSDGFCPSCGESVPMYTWRIEAWEHPWKVRCPHCNDFFPKNDFGAYYKSGLNEHGVFDAKLADRTLLLNSERPHPLDPVYMFGVDDGTGYVDGEDKWRFVATYLVYGQWKQKIISGVKNLAAAYVVTGDKRYAHKTAVLLDRIADLFPEFDYLKQGILYEGKSDGAGYVTYWCDTNEEVRLMAVAYDQIFDCIKDDAELVAFSSQKAAQYKLDNPKMTFADIQRNIEDRIFRDALNNLDKIHSNYPRQDYTRAILTTVLGWPENKPEVYEILGGIIEKSTAVDGTTGEKGITGYSSWAVSSIGELAGQFLRLDPDFIDVMAKKYPKVMDLYRFHIDTWCFDEYYPNTGDCGWFGIKHGQFAVPMIMNTPGLDATTYSMLWKYHKMTGDPVYAQVMYKVNGNSVENLPYEFLDEEPEVIQKGVLGVIKEHGTELKSVSVNKEEWHLAILKSGKGKTGRALWMDYDAGGGHGHMDNLNIGLFAKGLDFLPDFGYPPVQFGGWGSERSLWYTRTVAHNTVLVDGENVRHTLRITAGKTMLWGDGKVFRVMRVAAPILNHDRRFERTAALIDIDENNSYVLDIFRVAGGKDHSKFTRSHFGTISTEGLTLKECEPYDNGTVMRGFKSDPNPQPGWNVDWKIEDCYSYLPEGSDTHFRYTDLTSGAEAVTAESWVVKGQYNSSEETWIPTVISRRRSEGPDLESTFVSVMEPYEKSPNIISVKRLTQDDSTVIVEAQLVDGRKDLIIACDAEKSPEEVTLKEWGLTFNGDMCMVRLDKSGKPWCAAVSRCKSLSIGDVKIEGSGGVEFMEVSFDELGKPTIS